MSLAKSDDVQESGVFVTGRSTGYFFHDFFSTRIRSVGRYNRFERRMGTIWLVIHKFFFQLFASLIQSSDVTHSVRSLVRGCILEDRVEKGVEVANSVGSSISITSKSDIARRTSKEASALIDQYGVRPFLGNICITKRWVQEVRGNCWIPYETYQ